MIKKNTREKTDFCHIKWRGGMGCKAPRVGHCEAAIADKSEDLKSVGVSAGTGNKPPVTGTLSAPLAFLCLWICLPVSAGSFFRRRV